MRGGTLGSDIDEMTVTPGHHFLAADGGFRRIDEILADDGRIVLADGTVVAVSAERIVYNAETAHLYEEAEIAEQASAGATALAPRVKKGWKTYNFEVEGLHTYIAGGVRVHNDSLTTDFAPTSTTTLTPTQSDIGLTVDTSQVGGSFIFNSTPESIWGTRPKRLKRFCKSRLRKLYRRQRQCVPKRPDCGNKHLLLWR